MSVRTRLTRRLLGPLLALTSMGCIATAEESGTTCSGELVADAEGRCVNPNECAPGERALTAGGCAVPSGEECAALACDAEDRFGDRCQEACFVWRREDSVGAPPARAGACFAAVGPGEFLQFGGGVPEALDPNDHSAGFYWVPRADAHLLRVDPTSGASTWTALEEGPRPSARLFMACVALGGGRVLIIGGEPAQPEPDLFDAWIYESGSFTRLDDVPPRLARSLATAAALPDGGALILGGCRWSEGGTPLQDAWLFVEDPPGFVEVDTRGARLPTAGVLFTDADGQLALLGGLDLGPDGNCEQVIRVASASVVLDYAELHEVTLDRAAAPLLTLGASRDVIPALRVYGSISDGPLGPLLFGGYLLAPRSIDSDGGTQHAYAEQTCILRGEWTCLGPNDAAGGPRDAQPPDRYGAGLAADPQRYLLVGGVTHLGQALEGVWRFERCGADECPPVRPGE